MNKPKGRSEAGSAIHRRIMILKALPHSSNNWLSVTDIRNLLDNRYGINADERTIQRDLNSLLPPAFPIENDGKKPMGWRWQKGAHALAIETMDPQTALTFRMVEQFLAPLLPKATLAALVPYQETARKVLGYDHAGRLEAWSDKVAVFHRSEFLIPPELDEGLITTVYQALYDGKRLLVRYRPKGEEESREYVVNPLGLVLTDNLPYLVGTLWDYLDVKQLPLTRFECAELQVEQATPPPGFSLAAYVRSGEFSYPQRDGLIDLKLRMDRDRALHLKETRLHPDQTWTDLGDDTVEITARVPDTLQLRFWLNGFGTDVEVLAPAYLRDEYAEQAEELARQYRE